MENDNFDFDNFVCERLDTIDYYCYKMMEQIVGFPLQHNAAYYDIHDIIEEKIHEIGKNVCYPGWIWNINKDECTCIEDGQCDEKFCSKSITYSDTYKKDSEDAVKNYLRIFTCSPEEDFSEVFIENIKEIIKDFFDERYGKKPKDIPDPCNDEAIVRIMEINGSRMLRLCSSVNYDANNPIQIEEYSSFWTIGSVSAREEMLKKGFYSPFIELNDRINGGITLIDGLTEEEKDKYLSRAKYKMSRTDFVWYMNLLPEGSYLLT